MPELPEVQTTVNGINKHAKGLRIVDVWTDYGGAIHAGKNHIKNKLFFNKFKKEVVGAKILKAERKAKNILVHLSNNQTILIHMKMTGHILYGKYTRITKNSKLKTSKVPWVAVGPGALRDDPFNRFIHFVMTLSNKRQLALSDMRKFAKVTIIETSALRDSADLSNIGPEPLDKSFTSKVFADRLKTKPKGKIKTVLMDPGVVAGIGNIYSDEILWASNVHPLSIVSRLKQENIESVWKNTRFILKKGIDFGGDSMSDYRNIDGKPGKFQYQHKAYRQTGKLCPKKGCGGVISRLKIGGRSAHFCPVHQKLL